MDTSVYKLKQFSLSNDGSTESAFGAEQQTVEDLISGFKIEIISIDKTNYEMEFDMIGVGPPIANAIRRILLAEIPSMAVDRIHMYNNTTVIPDEVLAHRIGLIPIQVDPRVFVYKADDENLNEDDTIQFELKVKCTRKPNVPKNTPLTDETTCYHSSVYSGDLKFIPIGNQKDMVGDIRPVHGDILLAKMKPGHEIDLKAFCFKNIGREHAKFSPVVVAHYRFLPELTLKEEISGERAHTLAQLFPEGVIKISKKKNKEVAKVNCARNILCSRNVLAHDDLKDAVEITKKKNHYIFNVESVGALPPEELVSEAIKVLKEKCRFFLSELKSLKM